MPVLLKPGSWHSLAGCRIPLNAARINDLLCKMKTYTDEELVYSAENCCPCGAGLAHLRVINNNEERAWDCSDILTGRAIPSGQVGAKQHTGRLPFAFYEIKSERQPSARGRSTRPSSTVVPVP